MREPNRPKGAQTCISCGRTQNSRARRCAPCKKLRKLELKRDAYQRKVASTGGNSDDWQQRNRRAFARASDKFLKLLGQESKGLAA